MSAGSTPVTDSRATPRLAAVSSPKSATGGKGARAKSDRAEHSTSVVHTSGRSLWARVAATEAGVDTARLLSTRAEYHFGRQFSVALWSRNLLDDEYLISTDELSTEGEERTFGVALTWHSL